MLEIILKWFSRGYPISHPDVASIFFVSLRSTKNSEKSRNTPKYPEISWNIPKNPEETSGSLGGGLHICLFQILRISSFLEKSQNLEKSQKNLEISRKMSKSWKITETDVDKVLKCPVKQFKSPKNPEFSFTRNQF